MGYISKTTPDGRTVKVKDYKKRAKRNRRNRRVLFFTFIILCFVAFTLFAPFFNIKTIICTGNTKVTSETIIAASKIGIGNNIYRTNLNSAKRDVQSIPYISEARIKRGFPNIIKIDVTQSEVSAYMPVDGGYVYIDSVGKMLEQNTNPPTAKVPIIENSGIQIFDGGKIFLSDDTKKVEIIVATLQEIVHNSILDKVTIINTPSADKIAFTINNRLEVLVGDINNLPYKIGFMTIKALENLGNNASGFLDVSSGKNGVFRDHK